jgi:hypothetical protein
MANQDFDLKGWMQQNKQGVYKNSLNENYVDLKPINRLGEALEDDDDSLPDDEDTHKKAEKFAKKADKELAKLPKWDAADDDDDMDLYEDGEEDEMDEVGGSKKVYVAVVQGADYFEAFISENPTEVKSKMKSSDLYGDEETTTGMASTNINLPYIGVSWEEGDASKVTVQGVKDPSKFDGEFGFVVTSETPNTVSNDGNYGEFTSEKGKVVKNFPYGMEEETASEMDEGMFGGPRTEAFNILEVLRSDFGIAEGKILEYILGNYMSGDEALSAMEDAKEEFIGDEEDF